MSTRTPIVTMEAIREDADGAEIDRITVRIYGGHPPLHVGIGQQSWLLHETVDGVPRYRRVGDC